MNEAIIDPNHILAVYGSLRPGHENHHVVQDIKGEWFDGTVEGRMGSWGPYRRLIVGASASEQIPVCVLRSADLPYHWERLDSFEGSAYQRIVCPIHTDRGVIFGNVYAVTEAG
jgi:gamma-glutamylcyclotransferase (GGCT)/AIG2-like uncharacterized protein YtfP